jgi:hypothetical protein
MPRAMALSPLDPGFFLYLTVAGLASLFSGRPEYALELAKRSAALNPDWDMTYWAATLLKNRRRVERDSIFGWSK